MKHDLTTGTWQDDTGCLISIVLAATSDVVVMSLWFSSVLVSVYVLDVCMEWESVA